MSEAKDNLDSNYYSYSINPSKTFFTVGTFLENNQTAFNNQINNNLIITPTYATDYSKRFLITKGDSIGILTESGTTGIIPIEQSTTNGTGLVNLLTTTKDLTLNISKTNTVVGSGLILGAIQTLQNQNYSYSAPTTCPTGFISVPGNPDFNQPGFCVAKYEMKANGWNPGYYSGGTNIDGDYCDITSICGDSSGTPNLNKNGIIEQSDFPLDRKIKSSPEGLPIVYITQESAIQACKNIGAHLITNNEWMTIARNIESQPSNWSSNIVGSGYLYSGHNDNVPANALVATNIDTDSCYLTNGVNTICPVIPLALSSTAGSQKRTSILSNNNIIWDLAGNVWEHVNGINTINGTNYNTLKGNGCNSGIDGWNSFTYNASTDALPQCNFTNGYTYNNNGPKTLNLNASKGIGRIWTYSSANTSTDRIFLRGGTWTDTSYTGIFTLKITRDSSNSYFGVGFRCAK
ncbi:MAG: hypothetical protein PHZ26_03725 [Candidatus Gracilibacteria bacterium]|nr:hypothetical protein [Candidatus Gracilibacteria bacterium]MDD2908836.1 hypothetical protein [Candidatus Gracilibacteria bacterium]